MARSEPKTIVVDAYYLTYRQGGSDKFYQVLISEDASCILRWGRRGTSGQSSVSTMMTYDDAMDVGMRQVYAKKSKGYTQEHASKYVVPADVVRYAKEGNPHPLFEAIENARREGAYTGLKDAVLTHYNDLLERAQSLMSRADDMDFENVAEEYDHLEKAWEEIEERHAEIAISMSIAKTTFTKKLLGI